MSSNFLDIIYIVITCTSLASGLYSGAVKLIIGFVFFILSFVFAYLMFIPVTDVLHDYISSHLLVNIAGISSSYLISAICCSIVSGKLKKLVEDISGGMADRFLGLALGFARGIIISLMVFVTVLIITSKTYEGAKTVLDLVQPPEKRFGEAPVVVPHWVASSKFNPDVKMVFDEAINIIGKDNLKAMVLPAPKKEKESNAFDALKNLPEDKLPE